MADRFGGRRVMGISIILCGIATILMPVCARTSIVLVYVLRIIVGLASVSLFLFFKFICVFYIDYFIAEMFEDTKGVIRSCK